MHDPGYMTPAWACVLARMLPGPRREREIEAVCWILRDLHYNNSFVVVVFVNLSCPSMRSAVFRCQCECEHWSWSRYPNTCALGVGPFQFLVLFLYFYTLVGYTIVRDISNI